MIKGGLLAYSQSKGFISEIKETMSDLVEESRSELSGEQGQSGTHMQPVAVEKKESIHIQVREPKLETEGGTV